MNRDLLVAAMFRGDPDETLPLPVVERLADAVIEAGWVHPRIVADLERQRDQAIYERDSARIGRPQW